MSSPSEVIGIRLKLYDGKAVTKGIKEPTKAVGHLGEVTQKTSRISHVATGTTSRLTGAYKKLGTNAKWALGLVGAGALFGIESSISKTEELGKTTTNLSKSFGLNIKSASEWSAIAQAREIDSRSLAMSFGSLSKNMVEAARKGGTLLTPFHQVGISQEEVAKGTHNFNGFLNTTLEKLAAMPAGAKKMAAAKSLLGRGYQTLIPLLNESNMGFKAQLGWANEMGDTLDGKTNRSLEDMRTAQIKSKIAMDGLQKTLAMALAPAIEFGDDKLQDFIKTLNSPDLTSEQKIEKIVKEFQGMEMDLVHVIEKMAPEIAEQAGHLGLVMAKALGNAFMHSGLLGKAVMAGYLYHLVGGPNVLGLFAKGGGKLAYALGTRFLEKVAPYFMAEAGVEGIGSALSSQMGGLKTLFTTEGGILGTAMGVAAGAALAGEVYFAYKDSENIAGLSLVNTPKIGSTSIEAEATKLQEQGFTKTEFNGGNEIWATTSSGQVVKFSDKDSYGHWKKVTGGKPAKGDKGSKGSKGSSGSDGKPSSKKDASMLTVPTGTWSGPGPDPSTGRRPPGDGPGTGSAAIPVQHVHLYIDGKAVAKGVLKAGADRAALK